MGALRKLITAFLIILPYWGWAQRIGEPVPVWQEGQLDIHHINTGQGNATFVVFPEGTTLLIDAGAISSMDWRTNKPRNIPTWPSNERQAGEWIARYIRNVLRFQRNPAIDYAIVTHFHDDHMGTPLNVVKRSKGEYTLAGITEVAEYVPIHKMLDRGWPDYAYPKPMDADSMVVNYRRFLSWQQQRNGLVVERFQAGRVDQIVSVKSLSVRQKYPFEVRNLMVNGELWTGEGDKIKGLFPDLRSLKPADYPNENMCSIALQIRYGAFDYFSGADLQGVLQFGAPAWHDVETPVAQVVGPVDVQLVDHHGYPDSQNGSLLSSLQPRVLILPAWASSHPGRDVLERLFSDKFYRGERDVFATHLLPEAKTIIADLLPRLKSESGHIVIRVEKGGKRYHVLVLDDQSESYRVKAIFGPYSAR
ncbi:MULTISPECIES: MBL fold metallo-hydrolase [unclassified Spirosoma]|uniref:ComEC/Rec2 family competence protein n=1 Tax=unclassified Spirosoma TaxID=2621999 RepID=UPI00095BF71F|nr:MULTISPECIES: MBL fold metallo-hydrolase [unclassified Spirosoma]MBN8823681.1 hypothetical protein [Spirosoma sp.]OJW76768.1 MAG: hypothetical protein BGO59_21265 [Spirosoma sp. 48-14]